MQTLRLALAKEAARMASINRRRLVCGLYLALLFAGMTIDADAESQPATKTPDPRVEAALEQTRLAYGLDNGDFVLEFQVGEARSQRVWVASDTAKVGNLEVRDVWSVASRGQGSVPEDLAVYLLKENARMILGAWQVNQGQGEYLVVFLAPVSAEADPATLQGVIEVVMYSSDRIEKALTGKDEF
jgi:hypothetical protein